MPPTITYSLTLGSRSSADYHQTIANFADRWTGTTLPGVAGVAGEFQAYLNDSGRAGRSGTEIAFEMLVLGVLLREHGSQIALVPNWYLNSMEKLVKLQASRPQLEGAIKACRGLLAGTGKWLKSPRPGSIGVKPLIAWLRAIGE